MQVRHDMIACHVVRRDAGGRHEFLQLHRRSGDFMGGTWQCVSGRIETGETAWQAALRELLEETGLRPREFFQVDYVESFYIASMDTVFHRPAFCALVHHDDAVTLNDEHDAHRWVPIEQVQQVVMWQGERTALAEIVRDILSDSLARPYLRIPT